MLRGAAGVLAVELVERRAEARGIAAHLVERGEPHGTVERRVLDAFGGDGRGELLEAHRELDVALAHRVVVVLASSSTRRRNSYVEPSSVASRARAIAIARSMNSRSAGSTAAPVTYVR